MKKLSMICMITLAILSVGQVFALPGIYNAGSSTMNLTQGECETRTISMDGTGWGTSPLMSGGFCLSLDPTKIDVNDIWCYQEVPPFWPTVEIIPDPGFTCVFTGSPDEGVPPSSNILICDVEFCGAAIGNSIITIDTVPEMDTWVAQDLNVYDPTIDADVIEARVWGNPCECIVSGPFEVQAGQANAVYTASPDADCEYVPAYAYSDDSVQGTIDPTTGILTVPEFLTPPAENCSITVTDTANADINTGEPVVCGLDIRLLAGFCDCPGNFDHDWDVDGTDAATFKADFGRG